MAIKGQGRQTAQTGGPAGTGIKGQQSEEEREAAASAANRISTAVRTRRVVPERIQRRAPRSGLQVTRPAEDQFMTGPNVTGVNELEDL